jgi:hypothetical protein
LNDTGLYIHEDTLRLYDPYVSIEFEAVNLENRTESNYISIPFVSAIDMIYLYPLDGLNITEPINCNLPNCTCPVNQTVRFYQNDSETPCYDCECSDIPVEIRIRNVTIPCPTYTTTTCPTLPLTTTTVSTSTVSTTTVTTSTTRENQEPKAETPNEPDEATSENSEAMTTAGIISVTLLSVVLLIFIILVIFMIRQNNEIKARNRFLEEDSTRKSIRNEITSSYDNPLFVPSHYEGISFQGPHSDA